MYLEGILSPACRQFSALGLSRRRVRAPTRPQRECNVQPALVELLTLPRDVPPQNFRIPLLAVRHRVYIPRLLPWSRCAARTLPHVANILAPALTGRGTPQYPTACQATDLHGRPCPPLVQVVSA